MQELDRQYAYMLVAASGTGTTAGPGCQPILPALPRQPALLRDHGCMYKRNVASNFS